MNLHVSITRGGVTLAVDHVRLTFRPMAAVRVGRALVAIGQQAAIIAAHREEQAGKLAKAALERARAGEDS